MNAQAQCIFLGICMVVGILMCIFVKPAVIERPMSDVDKVYGNNK